MSKSKECDHSKVIGEQFFEMIERCRAQGLDDYEITDTLFGMTGGKLFKWFGKESFEDAVQRIIDIESKPARRKKIK